MTHTYSENFTPRKHIRELIIQLQVELARHQVSEKEHSNAVAMGRTTDAAEKLEDAFAHSREKQYDETKVARIFFEILCILGNEGTTFKELFPKDDSLENLAHQLATAGRAKQ
jgi:hypothetical protein